MVEKRDGMDKAKRISGIVGTEETKASAPSEREEKIVLIRPDQGVKTEESSIDKNNNAHIMRWSTQLWPEIWNKSNAGNAQQDRGHLRRENNW